VQMRYRVLLSMSRGVENVRVSAVGRTTFGGGRGERRRIGRRGREGCVGSGATALSCAMVSGNPYLLTRGGKHLCPCFGVKFRTLHQGPNYTSRVCRSCTIAVHRLPQATDRMGMQRGYCGCLIVGMDNRHSSDYTIVGDHSGKVRRVQLAETLAAIAPT